MRRNGMSIKAIASSLGVSSGSVSIWCQSITLSDEQVARIRDAQIKAGHRGRLIGAEMNRKKRETNILAQEAIARSLVGTLTPRDQLMLGIALYWGEGTKARGSTTSIVNSDPETVLFARRWFEQLGITRDLFNPCVFISEIHKPREKKILRYWQRLLEIPAKQFSRVVYIKTVSKKIYENHDSYYGVLALRIRKGSSLKYRILGLIRACKEQAGVAQLVRAVVS